MTRLIFTLLLTIFLANPVTAGTDSEIQHLLTFIEQSGCTFERNGTTYPSPEARSHIQKKYDYAARWIKTTEDFIKYTATKSSISGKPYHVTCQGERLTSASWLLAELERFRREIAAVK